MSLRIFHQQQRVPQFTSNYFVCKNARESNTNHFPWSIVLSTIEMTSKCLKLKWDNKPQTSGVCQSLQSSQHFDVIFLWSIGKLLSFVF